MLFWVLFILWLPFFLVRWSRWLAIVQQKEYRIDRLFSFLQSPEGQHDIWHLLPRRNEFTRTGLKRPVRTARVAVVATLSLAIIGLFMVLAYSYSANPFLAGSVLWILYVILPFLLLLSCLPTAIAANLLTLCYLLLAKQKLQKYHPKVIGIGGSYGKTSTKHLLRYVLAQKYSVFSTPKSHNTKYSIAKSIFQNYKGEEIAILEYGAYTKGEIEYMTKWFPVDMAVETGFTLQHYNLFGSEQNSLEAESELVAALPENGKVFCNAADHGALKICEWGSEGRKIHIVEYSGPRSVVQLSHIANDQMGGLHFGWKKQLVHTNLVGEHYLVNVQGVIAVSEELGLSDAEILQGLETFSPNSSFVLSSVLTGGALLIDDGGTSNPKGFAAVIELAAKIHRQKKILLTSGIVDLGTKSAVVHLELAKAAERVFSLVGYLGVDGQAEFVQIFDQRLLLKPKVIQNVLENRDNQTLIVIEGKVPKWIETELKS